MYITQEFLEKVGARSPMARAALVQAGDKIRVKALKKALLSIGVCEITKEEAKLLGALIREKKYTFMGNTISYVLLNEENFSRFKRINNSTKLEIAHIRNGLIGIKDKGQTE